MVSQSVLRLSAPVVVAESSDEKEEEDADLATFTGRRWLSNGSRRCAAADGSR